MMSNPTAKRASRMSLELPPGARQKVERLATMTDQSFSEVIRRAISLYDLFAMERMAGRKLIIRDAQGDCEIMLVEFEVMENPEKS